MARTVLTVNAVTRSAATAQPAEVTADAVNGNYYANGPTTFMQVRNVHATLAKNVTVTVARTVDGVTTNVVVKTYSIPANMAAGVYRDLGLFPASEYGDQVWVNGETTDIKFVVRRLA